MPLFGKSWSQIAEAQLTTAQQSTHNLQTALQDIAPYDSISQWVASPEYAAAQLRAVEAQQEIEAQTYQAKVKIARATEKRELTKQIFAALFSQPGMMVLTPDEVYDAAEARAEVFFRRRGE